MTLQDETTRVVGDDLDDAASIPMPQVTRRTEARRMREERRRERRRRNLRVAALALGVVLVVAAAVQFWPFGGGGGNGGNGNDAANPATAAAAATAPVLIAQQDPAGNATALTLIVPGAKGKGGALLLIPPGTMAEVPSLGLEPVGKSLGLGGAQRLDGTIENLLGVSVGEVLAFDDSRLAALVQPAGPLSVRVPERVEQVDQRGTVNVLYEAGLHKVQPQDVPRLLAAKSQSNDLARLARHQAVWDAWLARMRETKAAIPKDPPGLARALAALAAGDPDDVTTRVLPVSSLGASEDGELYQVNQEEVRALVSTLFPGQSPGGAARPRLQILNGTGQPGLAQQIADRLASHGVEVKLTGNAGRLDYAETQIVFYRREDEAVAQRISKALGVGKLVLSRNPLEVVDITVIVGRDFKAQ